MDFQSEFQGTIVTIGAGASATVDVLQSDELYKHVAVGVLPIQDSFADFIYTVDVYLDGSRIESNSSTVAGIFQTMRFMYSDSVYPPNIGWATKAGLRNFRYTPSGFSITIYNGNPETRSFEVYSTFEKCLGGAYRKFPDK